MGQGAKREIRTFKLFTVLFWFSNYIVTPYITPYLQSLGAGNIVIGYVVSSYSIAQILVRVPLGIASDRMGRRKSFIVAGAVLTLVSVTGLWLTRSVAWVFVFRTLQGLAVTSWVCATVLFAGYLRPEEAVGATVQLQVCNSSGTLVGYLLGGLVAKRFGYGSVFLVAASGAALALAVSARIAEAPPGERPLGTKALLRVGASPFLLFVAGMAVFGQIILSATTWGFTPQIATSLGADATGIAACSMCFSVAGLLAALLVTRRLSGWLGEKRTLVLAMALEAVFCIAQPYNPALGTLYVNCFLNGLVHNTSYSLLLGLAIELFPERMRAAAMGWHQAIYALGLLIGPVVAGYFSELYDLKTAFLVIGLLGLAGAVLAQLFYARARGATLRQMEKETR